ncbi:MAG: ribonuclease J [Oscillospiraceae bacterium]|nr:ribonuclease J [Oscillospiraceae bacterium]
MAEQLKIIPLGGLNEIGKNMTVYEYGGEIIVVDCGMAFPGDDMYGIDLVIPDVSYLVKHKNRIRGLFITHGHEDHIGAIPYVLKQVNMPIYCTRLTAGLIRLKLEEHGLLKTTKIITVESGMTVKAGKFSVEFIHVNHSIADSVAFAVHTALGTVVHTGDFKIDSTPIDGEVIDLARFGELGKNGVLALLADSTNVERPGYTMSERMVGKTFDRLFAGCKQRIIVTTFASNVHRIQQVIDAAAACGRKVAVTGRSMENVTKVATDLGYMKLPKNTVVDINKIKSLPLDKQVIVTTGSQGEEMSALYRMAFSQHKQIEVGPGDRVIISASAIPGNENTVSRVINELFRKGVEVIYNRADMLHVSGHACQEELRIIHALVRPKYFVPVHGEQRMLQLHKDLAMSMGMDRNHIAICENGDAVEIGARSMKVVPALANAGEVFVDGYGVGDVGAVVLRDRKHLAEDGMLVVVLPVSAHNGDLLAEPEIVTRGFIYVKESEELMQELKNIVMTTAEGLRTKRKSDMAELRGAIKNAVGSYLFKTTKRSPMIIPVVTRL